MWFLEKKLPKVPLLSGVLITFFGGLQFILITQFLFILNPQL